MASSSIAVVGRDSQRLETSTRLNDLDSDLSSYQNMEDASPGTIIFSPQDLRPLTVKKAGGGSSTAANIGDITSSGSGYNTASSTSNFHTSSGTNLQNRGSAKPNASSVRGRPPQTTMLDMTQAEKKAEDIATSIEKLKDIEGPVACQFCGKVMLSGKTLVQHMSIHAEYKPFQCPHCPKSFTRKVQLQGHLVVHGIEKQFECPVCHQRFSRRDCVKVHMRIHDKTKCAFCEVCHKSFLTMGALNIHMRIHRGEKPFKCHLCGKCFTQKNHLITHIKRHTNVQDVHFAKKLGPRMFQCEHCDRSFIRLSDYERHVQWNHGAVADVNNLPSAPLRSADGDENAVRAPRDVVRERSKQYKKQKKEPVVMCTSATQTDDSGGHIIIPRQYKQQYEMEQQQKGTPAPSEPSDTPRHIDEDTYDAYDEGMDRNYSSDDEDAEVSEENQPHQRIFNIDSTSIAAPTSSDPARDAAFDAIINSTNETSSSKSKLLNSSVEEGEHILPDSLDADQPNERVFIIQNENDSYEPTVTAGDCGIRASLHASEVITSSVSASSSSLVTTKGGSNSLFSSSHHSSKDANNTVSTLRPSGQQRSSNGPDLNSALDSDNFMQLVQNSYQSMVKGTPTPGTISSNRGGQDMTGIGGGGLRNMGGMPFVGLPPKNVAPVPPVYKSKRGRPKTKRTGIKGAAQLRLIRKSMMNFISDVEKREACKTAGGQEEGLPGEEDSMGDDAMSAEEEEESGSDPRTALEQQVLMSVDDGSLKSGGTNRPQRKRPLIKHGEDFLCASKSCRLCRPNLKNAADKNMMPAPGTLLKAEIKTEAKNVVVKKEQNLSQLAKRGSRKVAEIVNLLEFGVKNLDELDTPNQQSLMASSMYHSASQKSVLPYRPRGSEQIVNSQDEVYLAKTSVGDSIVSPPVDVQSFCIPTYSCKLCGREFRFEGKLHRHIESVHQKKNIFTSDVKPGRGQKTQFMSYLPTSMEDQMAGSSNNMIVSSLNSDVNLREHVHVSHHSEGVNQSDTGDSEVGASVSSAGTQETLKVKNPEIEALRSEWDDDDNDDEDDAEVRPTVTKPQPIFNATPLHQPHPASPEKQQRQQQAQQQRQTQMLPSGISFTSESMPMSMPIVTRNIQPMVTTVTDVYSGGVVVNMNKLTGLLPKTESKMDQDPDHGHGSGEAANSASVGGSLESNSLDSKCQKLLLKLFDRQLLVTCGLGQDHVSAVLGRVLQHYGVKMIEDYGQGQYEVLKYNLWRLMEWKVTIEQMEEFYSENKTVEEMMDDIMNERVPLVPHEVITQARAQEQQQQQQQQAARQRQQQQQVEEMVVPRMVDVGDHLVVEQQVEGEQVVMQGTEHMIVDQGSSQHIVVQGMDPSGQQIMVQNITDGSGTMHHDNGGHHQQIMLQQSQELSHDTAMLVQQVMSGHPQLAGVTQVVVAQDLSPEMLQGAHIVTIDPATGQVLSQVSADQVVLATHDGTIVSGSGQAGGTGTVVSMAGPQHHHQQEAIVVSREQMMMLQQQYNSQQQQQSSASAPWLSTSSSFDNEPDNFEWSSS